MSDEKKDQLLGRREFTSATIMALLSGVAVTVSGCSGGDNGNPMNPSNPGGGSGQDLQGAIADDHGHNARITGAELSAGNAVTLQIGGSADHPHSVALSAAEVMQIAAGQQVVKASSSDTSAVYGAHSHTVTFN